jgi:hypothetical protein
MTKVRMGIMHTMDHLLSHHLSQLGNAHESRHSSDMMHSHWALWILDITFDISIVA